MTANAILCAGLVVGFAIGMLYGWLCAKEEAAEMVEWYRRYFAARDARRRTREV